MKRIKIIILTLVLLLGISIVWLLFSQKHNIDRSFSFSFNLRGPSNHSPLTQELTYNYNEVDAISIDAVVADVTFILGTGDDIIVRHTGETDSSIITASKEGSRILIHESQENWFFNIFNNDRSKIEITLPTMTLNDLDIQTVSGDINANSVSALSATMRTTSGDIDLVNSAFTSINTKTISGDFLLNVVSGALDLSSVSGDVTCDNFTGNVNITTISGDVNIKDFTMISDSTINTTSGDISLVFNEKTASLTSVLNSVSGSVHNNFAGDTALDPIHLNINSVSGDITIR